MAVVLVVLFHANWSVVSGGYVGVDVFFVISGFVITGVLLRERASSGRTSILAFYGRRCRRIIPAATSVIIITIIAAYIFLGVLSGNRTAVDGRWAAIFLVNFHFASEGTNYLASQQLPSPLQNFWSLSVEEQFYLVYPTFFLLIASLRSFLSLRVRLAIGLGLVTVVSFAFSVAQTSSNPTVAYFSPWTRAWELALGGLVALGARWLVRIPLHVAAAITWIGLGAILISAVVFNSQTAYPGSLVAFPVVGAALIIVGGTAAPRFGAELLLGLSPCRWLGDLSYSLYLWHWPILIIAAEYSDKTGLTFVQNLPWLALALGISIVSYRFLENPVRHAKILFRHRSASVVMGAVLIALSVVVATVFLQSQTSGAAIPTSRVKPATDAQLAKLVAASLQIQQVPHNLDPPLQSAEQDYGAPPGRCVPTTNQVKTPSCVFGDPNGTHTMVLYGDSHALMWFKAMNEIATAAQWRLVILGKGYCMANKYPPKKQLGGNVILSLCNRWQQFAYRRIRKLDPNLVIVTQEVQSGPQGKRYTASEWQKALEATLTRIKGQQTKFIVLGNIPNLGLSPPDCLAQHPDQVQLCSAPVHALDKYDLAEQRAVTAQGGRYIDATPWFCTTRCASIIGHYEVYLNQLHVTGTYSLFLEQVLAEKLQLSKY